MVKRNFRLTKKAIHSILMILFGCQISLKNWQLSTKSPRMRQKRCFSTVHGIALLSQGIDRVKMCTQSVDKLMQAGI